MAMTEGEVPSRAHSKTALDPHPKMGPGTGLEFRASSGLLGSFNFDNRPARLLLK